MQNKIDAIVDKWADNETSMVASPRKHAPPTSRSWRPKKLPTALMVDAAIKSQMMQTRRRGVSYTAIKKYIAQNYHKDEMNLNKRYKFIKRYILNSLENGKLVRTTGSGISGSFRFGLADRQRKQQRLAAKKKRATKKKRAAKMRQQLHKHAFTNNSSSSNNNGNSGTTISSNGEGGQEHFEAEPKKDQQDAHGFAGADSTL